MAGSVAFTALLILAHLALTHSCSSLILGKGATQDGSVIATHTNDGGADTDPRLVSVPARRHKKGSLRPVFASPESYPRYSGRARGITAYYPDSSLNQTEMVPLGFIPEVERTYQYLEQTYGALNEKQVGIGESTCSSLPWSQYGGKATRQCSPHDPHPEQCALFSVDELSRVCMERASTSRRCVQIMGQLAEKHGFYGADGFEGTGESLLVVDKHEGWIFHVLSHPSGSSAIWGAERVPDDHVGVVANMFTIRSMNLSDPSRWLGSETMVDVARQHNLSSSCQSLESCDFTATFSDGEYAHKYYSGRRMWRAYDLLAHTYTSTHLSSNYSNLKADAPYPSSVPVDRLASLDDVFSVHRDFYQGTPFDLTVGLAAGPYGSPNRWSAGAGEKKVQGSWERPISLYRTSDSHVVQARSWLPDPVGGTLWFAPHAPQTSVYVPLSAGVQTVSSAYSRGYQAKMDKRTAFWAHRSLAFLVDGKFDLMYQDVQAAQRSLEAAGRKLQAHWDREWDETRPEYGMLTGEISAHGEHVVQSWWELFDHSLFKYADGWVNVPQLGQAVGYPAWWLKAVGYRNGPGPVEGDQETYPQLPAKLQ